MTDLLKRQLTICALGIGLITDSANEEEFLAMLQEAKEEAQVLQMTAALHGETADFLTTHFKKPEFTTIYHQWIKDNFNSFASTDDEVYDIIETEWNQI